MVEPAVAVLPVPVMRSLVTSVLGGDPDGTVTTGFLASDGGIVGVVGIDAWVAPEDGASSTPGALDELPQAASASVAAAAASTMRTRFGITRRGRVARSSKRDRSGGDPLEHGCVDVEVRVHVRYVVRLLEKVDQLHQLAGVAFVDGHPALGPVGQLGVLDVDARLTQRIADGHQVARGRDDLEHVVVLRDVLGAGVDGGDQIVLAIAGG